MRRRVLAVLCAAALPLPLAVPAHADAGPAGVDVASYQHPGGAGIDWDAVARSGVTFAVVKATEGDTYTNPAFAADYQGARDAGLFRSAYHYARPELPPTSAVTQADRFVAVAGTGGELGDLPPTLDLEESGGLSPGELVAWTEAFVGEVRALTGRVPIIYTYRWFWVHAMGDSPAFHDDPLWLADYGAPAGPREPLPGGWPFWTFWQYTPSGRVPGVPAPVDRDVFNGDLVRLRLLATPPVHPLDLPGTPVP